MRDRCPTCHQPVGTAVAAARHEILEALSATTTTQATLAERLGMSEKHVSNVLTGRVGLSFDLAERMLGALGRRLVVRSATEEPIG